MFDAPAMREFAPLYARHENSGLRAPARAWALRDAEALRRLLLGLDARKDAKMARARKGQKLVVTRLAADAEASHAASARPLSSEEFEALALYLRVDFADDETGSIVAVVDKDPTGEVLNALLQTESLVVATGAWS